MFTARALALWLITLLWNPRASAQACQAPDVRDRDQREVPFRVALAMLAGTYRRDEGDGRYQGLYARFAYSAPWWGAELLLPAYRLDRSQGVVYGVGDMIVSARGVFYRGWEGDLEAGVELPWLLPTGDRGRELGLGYVMPMPDLYFSLHAHPLVLRAQAGYGHTLGMRAARSEERTPIVNPLNRSELEHSLLVGLGLQRELSVHVRWWGAVPLADSMGVLRQAIAGGVTGSWDWFDLTFELQHALVGGAFEYRELLQAGALF